MKPPRDPEERDMASGRGRPRWLLDIENAKEKKCPGWGTRERKGKTQKKTPAYIVVYVHPLVVPFCFPPPSQPLAMLDAG
jgi:hypothetical protein